MQSNSCGIKTSNDLKSFKYGSFDLSSDHPISIRGISLTSYHNSIIIISSHEMTAYQHHNNVVLQSQDISLMRCNITCLSDLFLCLTRIVCFTSLTDGYIVTCRALLLYCWRVRLFRFFLAGEFDCCWVIVEGGSDCGIYGVDDLIASGVDITICWVAACLADWIATCLIVSCLAYLWRI